MQGIDESTLRKLKTRVSNGFLILVMLPLVLGGCATDGKEKALVAHETNAGIEPAKVPEVARLEDGREGFVITEFPSMDEASRGDFDRAVAILENGDNDEAIVLLEKVIEKSPGVTAPYINIAIAYQRTGRLKQAEENFKTAIKLFPGHPVACNEYGLLYRRTGRFAEAKAMYEKAIEGFPDYYPAHRNLGILCDLYLSDLSCALEHYKIYSEARPEDEQVKLWVADLRTRLGGD
jgi:tetratricopeptide (TPR) repeat protein